MFARFTKPRRSGPTPNKKVESDSVALIKNGIPFIILMVAGTLGLAEFTSLKYEAHGLVSKMLTKDDITDMELTEKVKGFDIYHELKKLELLDVDNWQQVPVPKPTSVD